MKEPEPDPWWVGPLALATVFGLAAAFAAVVFWTCRAFGYFRAL